MPVMGREPPPALAGDRDSQGLWDPRGTPGQGCASLGTGHLVPLLLPPVLCPALAAVSGGDRGLCLSHPGDVRSWGPGSGDARGAVSPPVSCQCRSPGVPAAPVAWAGCRGHVPPVSSPESAPRPHTSHFPSHQRGAAACAGTTHMAQPPCTQCPAWHAATSCHLPSPHPMRTLSQPSLGQRPSP